MVYDNILGHSYHFDTNNIIPFLTEREIVDFLILFEAELSLQKKRNPKICFYESRNGYVKKKAGASAPAKIIFNHTDICPLKRFQNNARYPVIK